MQATLKFDHVALAHYITVRIDGSHNHPISKVQYLAYLKNHKITEPVLLRMTNAMSDYKEGMKAIIARVWVTTRWPRHSMSMQTSPRCGCVKLVFDSSCSGVSLLKALLMHG